MNSSSNLPVILLISSDIGKISFIKKNLKQTYAIMDTDESQIAYDWLKNIRTELIILDHSTINDLLENICASARSAAQTIDIPILLITNKIQKKFIFESLKAGITDFLHEPLNEQELFERISVCLKSKFISKKIEIVKSKINSSPLIPQNTQIFLHRALLNDQSLKEISKAKKIAMPLSILMIEIDNFNQLSKDFGTLTIEEISIFIENFITSRLRQFDTLLPQGGGRYIMMLPKTSDRASTLIAEDIRKEICRATINTKKKEFIVTVSIGLVSFDKQLNDAAEAYEQFDRSLQQAKICLEKAQIKGNKIISNINYKGEL